mmetsp:Transcript_13030/g.37601  ORF Transcript_13030/g.37601 Transcript_13030/m.37601 type:complete len:226 (-) Transcript_13030:1335-2012(-)
MLLVQLLADEPLPLLFQTLDGRIQGRRWRRLTFGRLGELGLEVLDLRNEHASTTPLEPKVASVQGGGKKAEHEGRMHQTHDLALDDAVLPSDGERRSLGHQPRGGHHGSQCQCIDVKTIGYGRLGLGIGRLGPHGQLVGEETPSLKFRGQPGRADRSPSPRRMVHRSHHRGHHRGTEGTWTWMDESLVVVMVVVLRPSSFLPFPQAHSTFDAHFTTVDRRYIDGI